jgi:protein-disulfide isomerase
MTSRKSIVAAVLVAAALLAAVLIGVSLATGGGDEKTAATTSAATGGGEPTIKATSLSTLTGVPRHGSVLGKSDAPVTLIEYADVQCPFCARFTKETLPVLIRRWVKPGKLKIEFRGISFLGDDSDKALRFVLAAGGRGKLWETVELLYENQGTENTGWVTDGLLRAVARKAGLDPTATLAAAERLPQSRIDRLNEQSSEDGVAGTPAFLMARKGGTPVMIGTGALGADAFTPAIEAALTP